MYKPFTVDESTKILIEKKLKLVAPELTKKGIKWMLLFGCDICCCIQPNAIKYIPIVELIDVIMHKVALLDKNPSSLTWPEQLDCINDLEEYIFLAWVSDGKKGQYFRYKLNYLINS